MPAVKSLPGLPADYTSRFFLGDLVTKLVDPSYRGKVARAWATEEDLPPLPDGVEEHPLDRPLKRGEVGIVGVRQQGTDHAHAIVPEASLVLVQRDFLIGTAAKRSLTAIEAAVVVDQTTEVQLKDLLTGQRLPGWIPREKITTAFRLERGDVVVHDNWLGQVDDVRDLRPQQSLD